MGRPAAPPSSHPIDILLAEVARRVKCRKVSALRETLQINTWGMKLHNTEVPLSWYVKIYDLTGMSIDEQREIAGTKPVIDRDPATY